MSLPDDITADLPPPGDDEPASLRRDIFDELADHLACALARETQLDRIASQPPGGSAWSRVLLRFGNPRAIAFRLWCDALQEKLIMQRWLAGGMIALAVVLSAGMILGFRVLRDQQQLLIAQQELTAEALRQLTARAEERPAPVVNDIEWVPAEIRLEGATPGQAAPPGFRVRMSLREQNTSMPPWEAMSDAAGVVQFLKVRYGQYDLQVEAPWGESLYRVVNVNPGTPFRLTLHVPQAAPEPLVLKVEFVVPESLQALPLWIDFPIGMARRAVNTETWSVNGADLIHYGAGEKGLVGIDGQLRPSSRSDELDRFLVYGNGGELAGIRWPDKEYRVSGPLSLWTGRNMKFFDGSEVLLRFQRGLAEPEEVRIELDSEARRLRIVLTEKGKNAVEAMLAKLEATPAENVGTAGDGVARHAAFATVPTKRP